MVIAMLAMLFIVGAAFLSNVTFESQSIAKIAGTQNQNVVIDQLLREVRTSLRQGFLGNDGKAWNAELGPDASLPPDGTPDPSPIGNDMYGEIPGVHPLIASIEPYQDMTNWYFRHASDLELVMQNPPIPLTQAVDNGPGPMSGANLVYLDTALGQAHTHSSFSAIFANQGTAFNPMDGSPILPNEISDGESILRDTMTAARLRIHRRDADGDGVWDSYEYALPAGRFPSAVRRAMAEQLRASNFNTATDGDPEAVYYALRVISHGAMVDLGHAHELLLNAVLNHASGGTDETPGVLDAYLPLPEGEEHLLRRRFLLPPRDLPLSSLQSPPASHGLIPETLYRAFVGEANWPAFHDENSVQPQWTLVDTGLNGDMMNSPTASGIAPGSLDTPGWLDWMDPTSQKYDYRHLVTTASYDDNLMRMGRDAGAAIDWVDAILPVAPATDNPAFGIDNWPADNAPVGVKGRLKVSPLGLYQQIADDSNGTITSLASLLALGPGNANYERFVKTIQDAFTLMLRSTSLPVAEAETTAAALTANLIDFADTDDMPTKVAVRDRVSGAPKTEGVYGLERQPFITEVLADRTMSNEHYAVELFNPNEVTNGSLQLSNYRIRTRTDAGVISVDEALTSATMPGRSFRTIRSDGSVTAAGPAENIMTLVFGTSDTKIELIRRIGSDDVIVDQVTIMASLDTGPSNSMQREFTLAKPWFVTIPDTVGPIPKNLGTDGSEPAGRKQIEVLFANTGDLKTAFPTTGSLLLLMRYANSKDAPFNATTPTNELTGTQVDDGHMPVFDQTHVADSAASALALRIPWGQLVFDYFTALPLENDRATLDPTDPLYPQKAMIPDVDLGGVRVHGRIDINAAPWTVLRGLPMVPKESIPMPFQARIAAAAGLQPGEPTSIGSDRAKSIVAYREARQLTSATPPGMTGNYATGVAAGGDRLRADGPPNTYTGFLSVGELANVRRNTFVVGANAWDFDSGNLHNAGNEDYVTSVAVLVALGDWVTTRSHVFTVYGTLRGAGQKSNVDEKAIRFQETVDRLPSLFNNRLPGRIGPRVVGPYAQASGN